MKPIRQDDHQARQMLTAREASKLLGINRITLWRATKAGNIKPGRIGRRLLYELADIERLIDKSKRGGVKL